MLLCCCPCGHVCLLPCCQDLVVIDVLPQMVALSEAYFQVYQCQQQQQPAAAKGKSKPAAANGKGKRQT